MANPGCSGWLLCLAEGIADLKARLGRILVGFDRSGDPVTAAGLRAVGAMAALGAVYGRREIPADYKAGKEELYGSPGLYRLFNRLPKEFTFERELLRSRLWRSPARWELAHEQ